MIRCLRRFTATPAIRMWVPNMASLLSTSTAANAEGTAITEVAKQAAFPCAAG
jgi:hypothetical protein